MGKYFLILKTGNLGQYFSRGIIIPSNYINGWLDDLQSKIDNTILITKTLRLDKSYCGIELEITEDEIKYIEDISNDFYTLSKPIPITRIRKIYFENEKQREVTILNIQSSDAYIHNEIIATYSDFSDLEFQNYEFKINIPQNEDLKIKQDLFDKILGGFALMKLGRSESFKEYSDNYFNYLSHLNFEIKKITEGFFNNFNNELLRAIEVDNQKNLPFFFSPINISVANKLLKKELPISRLGNIQIEKINVLKEYNLAILATYGNDYGKTKKIDDFISSLTAGNFKSEWLEQICLYFGINQGYNAFKNEYKFKNQDVVVKFKLDSELDYTIIESIYQYVFNNKKENYQFNYLSWCPKYKNDLNTKEYETILLFDKSVIIKKKIILGSEEYLQTLLDQFSKISIFENIKIKVSEYFELIVNDLKKFYEHKLSEKEIEISELKSKLKEFENKNKTISEVYLKSQNKEINEVSISPKMPLDIETDLIKLRLLALDKITQIGELKGVAKFIGIKNKGPFNTKDIDKLKKLITSKLNEQLK